MSDRSPSTTATDPGLDSTTTSTSNRRPGPTPDLVVVNGEAPDQNVRAAISRLGGMERFVKRDAKVVVKPNVLTGRPPEYATTTNPLVVSALVRMCLEAGAAEVTVLDYPTSSPRAAFKESGIAQATEEAGGRLKYLEDRHFERMEIPEGRSITSWPFVTDVFEADTFINVPIGKTHGMAGLTLAMKNLMGVMGDPRGRIHIDFPQKITDVNTLIKPHLVVLDAYRILVRNGPTGGDLDDVEMPKTVVVGTSQTAVDAYGATIMGEATGIEVKKSICAICDPTTQCGLDCYVKDGRVVKVEGTLENPQNVGTLCAKGAAQRQWVYHEERVRTPLKRVGPRGSGQMVPISWEEALDTIAGKLQQIKAESGPESVVFYCGYPKQPRPFLQRLAMQYGSPNYGTESSSCFTAALMAWRLNYGAMAGPDLANTKCALIWGKNLFHSGTTASRHLLNARERGVKFIVVDPRATGLNSIADIHLALRPGTDGALALAMADVIISEGLYDREFTARMDEGLRRVPRPRCPVPPRPG